MQVVEVKTHRIIPNGFNLHDADMAPPGDDLFLARRVTLNLRRRTFDAQVFRRQLKNPAVVEANDQNLFRRLEPDLRGAWFGAVHLSGLFGRALVVELAGPLVLEHLVMGRSAPKNRSRVLVDHFLVRHPEHVDDIAPGTDDDP